MNNNDHLNGLQTKVFMQLSLATDWIVTNIEIPANVSYSKGVINFLTEKDGNIPCRIYPNTHGGVEQIETLDASTETVINSITVTKDYEKY